MQVTFCCFGVFFWQWVHIFGVLNEDCFANLHMLFQWLSCWWRLEHKPKKKQVIHSCTGFCRDELQVFSKDVVTCYLPPLLIASSSAHLDVFCVPFEPYDISWSSLSIFIFDLQFCILFNFFLGQSYEMHHLSVHHMTFVKIKCWKHVLTHNSTNQDTWMNMSESTTTVLPEIKPMLESCN